jgi:tRNA(fMet)-specific endonuclease VapC
MIVLDTDHLTEFQRGTSAQAQNLRKRIDQSGEDPTTTIVNVEEQMRGWLALIHRHRPRSQVAGYAELQRLFAFFADWTILPWDDHAADQFDDCRKAGVRIGTMDLKIAGIVLVHGGVLLSRNLRDFQQVPGLQVEDWLS